ncbi:MAG TPA: type II toxin-antitoxin system VapC family toxin [Clostridia bacterium]|nr:type II toxin-antitoxin system VapC family toxin [Clostridia bacterium]
MNSAISRNIRTAMDTSILFDLLLGRSPEFERAKLAIQGASQEGALICSDIVYAELAAYFRNEADVASFLGDFRIKRIPFTEQALMLAARAWKAYTSKKPRKLQCSRCGAAVEALCPKCGSMVSVRQHILTDFLIGAHAEAMGCRLLTRDRGYYRQYFPDLNVIEP